MAKKKKDPFENVPAKPVSTAEEYLAEREAEKKQGQKTKGQEATAPDAGGGDDDAESGAEKKDLMYVSFQAERERYKTFKSHLTYRGVTVRDFFNEKIDEYMSENVPENW